MKTLLTILGMAIAAAGYAQAWTGVLVSGTDHPAAMSAARLIARGLGLPETAVRTNGATEGAVVLRVQAGQPGLKHDGYTATFEKENAVITGARPRSLLFAAGDLNRWKSLTEGRIVRDPAFARRVALYAAPRHTLPEFVAALGCNAVHINHAESASLEKTLPEVFSKLSPEEQKNARRRVESSRRRFADIERQCQEADVEFLPMVYGNDFEVWSGPLYKAAIAAFPSAKGKSDPHSWERGSLCPADPATWKIMRAYIRDVLSQTSAHGLYVTFWDRFGLYCQCDRCKADGLDKFPDEVARCIQEFAAEAKADGRELIVRTWSSGAPHWLGDRWVHAPGYGGPGGTALELWGKAFREVPQEVTFQTKVYNADCQPAPPFSPLLGQAKPHAEIAEWQITGQTTGLFYFPASTVDHTAWTMKKAFALIGAEGGVCIYPGGTKQGKRFDVLDDICNSCNIHAWRELSWNPDVDVNAVWMEWATPIYGAKAAPEIVKALRLSEDAVNKSFSTLGLGSSTESGFAKNIARRESLLRYTNRFFLPEGQKALEPTLENVARVITEKDGCLRNIDGMFAALEKAKPDLKPEHAEELAMRFDWLRQFCLCAKALDESLWRFRYLRALGENGRTDAEQLKAIETARDFVHEQTRKLFSYKQGTRMSPFDCPLGRGEGFARVSLGDPRPLADELATAARTSAERKSR